MSDDTQIVPPANTAEPKVDNGTLPPQGVKPEESSPPARDNEDLTPEKREELSAKLRASKDEALRLKAENEELEKKLLEQQSQPQPTDPAISDTDVQYFKAIAKKAGIPFREDVEKIQQTISSREQTEAFNGFLKTHPEYNRPGDPKSDVLWTKFTQEFQDLARYKRPESADEFKSLLHKVHKLTSIDETTLLAQGKALGYAQANIQEQAKIGGSASGVHKTPSKTLTPEQQKIKEGFASVRPEYFKE